MADVSVPLDFASAILVVACFSIILRGDLPSLGNAAYSHDSSFLEMDVESPDKIPRFEGEPLKAEDLCCKDMLSTCGK